VSSQSSTPLPPDQSTVIGRSLCLGALIVRGTLESAIQLANGHADSERFNELANRLSRWLNEQDFTAQFTIDELDALSSAPGSWSEAQHLMQSDRIEAIGILRWSLSMEDVVPNYDQPFSSPDLQSMLGWPADAILSPSHDTLSGFPYNGTELLTGLAELRPSPALLAQRGAADCWLWRVNMASHQHAHPTPPVGHDYAMMIGIAAEEARSAGAIGRPVKNDFPVQGRPFSEASPTVQAQCGRLAAARHLALNWLCGYASAWDELPIATAA
jgi:hypothetical protein